MKLDYNKLLLIINDVKNKVINNHISNITLINSHDMIFTFSMFRKERLLISLNHDNPFVALIKNKESVTTTACKLNDHLRKNIRDSLIKNISLENEDKIIKFELEKSNDFFEKETHYLFLELISHKPNLLITDSNNKIEYVLHPTSLDSNRILLSGIDYELPKKASNFQAKVENFDLEEYYCQAEEYMYKSKEDKLLERYEKLFKFIKTRIKSLNSKLKVLEQEIANAKGNLIYSDYGNMLLALQNQNDELEKYIIQNSIDYDKEKSIGANANLLFKKYKKAKRTIELDLFEIDKAKKEIEKFETILIQKPYFNDEDLLELSLEIMPKSFKSPNLKVKSKISYIECDIAKIYFGKTATQNDELTFKLASKQHYYFHIKDYHGAHVIVASENPTKKQIQIACEMCLILSNKTAGDIMYSQVKFLKKGKEKGQVLMPTYKLITLNNINETTQDLLKNFHQ